MLQVREGWGQMANQLYQHHWDTNEHSGWSDEEEHDPDLPLGDTSKTPQLSLVKCMNLCLSCCSKLLLQGDAAEHALDMHVAKASNSLTNRQLLCIRLFE